MIIVFLSAILMVFCVYFFSLSFSIQGVKRALISAPIELMHSAVLFQDDGVHFNKTKFENVVITYFGKIIPRYASEHDVEFYYYNLSDGSMCIEDQCDGVEITLNCKLTIGYEYSNTMFYEIRGNE